jgi:DNA-3-methyladenine glycosylase
MGGRTAVKITEVEAYGGTDDAASHADRGRTPGNGSMFGPAGTLYVYRSYGIHWCANLATGPEGVGQAVLWRGGVILDGHDLIEQRRGRCDHLTDGPGKLTQALGITGDHDVSYVSTGAVRMELNPPVPDSLITATPRIGITKETARRWRFMLIA